MGKEKILLRRNESAVNDALRNIQAAIPYLQLFVEEANNLQLKLTTDNWFSAAKSPELFAIEQFAKEIPEAALVQHGRFKQTKGDILRTLDTPDTSLFCARADALMRALKYKLSDYHAPIFKISEGSVEIDEEQFERLVAEKYSDYAATPGQIKLWNACSEMTESINRFNDLLKNRYGISTGIHNLNFSKFMEKKEGKLVFRIPTFKEIVARSLDADEPEGAED